MTASVNPYVGTAGDSPARIKQLREAAIKDASDATDGDGGTPAKLEVNGRSRDTRQRLEFSAPWTVGGNQLLGHVERAFAHHYLKMTFFTLAGAYGGSLLSRNLPLALDRPLITGTLAAMAGATLAGTFIDHHHSAGPDDVAYDHDAAKRFVKDNGLESQVAK